MVHCREQESLCRAEPPHGRGTGYAQSMPLASSGLAAKPPPTRSRRGRRFPDPTAFQAPAGDSHRPHCQVAQSSGFTQSAGADVERSIGPHCRQASIHRQVRSGALHMRTCRWPERDQRSIRDRCGGLQGISLITYMKWKAAYKGFENQSNLK